MCKSACVRHWKEPALLIASRRHNGRPLAVNVLVITVSISGGDGYGLLVNAGLSVCAGLKGGGSFLMPSRQRSNPLLGGMDCPSSHMNRHRGSQSSSISEQRSTAVCKPAPDHPAARCPGHTMHLAWLKALHLLSMHACYAVGIMPPPHRAFSTAVRSP